MNDSIFTNPNYKSPLGNWLGNEDEKSLSIKYQNCNFDDKFFFLNFQITAKNLTLSEAIIFVGESEVFGSETAVPNTKININVNGSTASTVQFKKDFKFSKSIFEGDLEFFAIVTCDSLSAKTDEFSLSCAKKDIPKEKEMTKKEEEKKDDKPQINCDYTIKDGFLIGKNVTNSRKDNKVKPGGDLNKVVKAIILHRTVGSGISGAISHAKGTHFYVEGNKKGTDGEIFQAMSLTKRSSHIKDVNTRISHFDVKNENSIGIEVVGMAYLKIGEKYYMNLADKKEVSPPPPLSREYIDKNKNKNYWDALTEAQIKSVVCLVKLLMKEYSIPLTMVLTHEEIQSKTAGEGQAVKEAIFTLLT